MLKSCAIDLEETNTWCDYHTKFIQHAEMEGMVSRLPEKN